ncbi:hypothetical protein [Paraburkholderia hospita]|uniref:hypothetical protein n=1 Tax=Paraburkholderia hospita TaxID=169430 RepID=UPI000B342533|nr:hypothetical protein [Paraburkholderia hospita]OUL70024.1 hypothetical protein CA603_49860 [Paraburkholderia hospita]OUL79518.1 hypothetical protein CA601_34650 [Paraburkholderia hospita]
MKIEGKRVPITGGSSGIGLAHAHAFFSRSANVVVTGRGPDAHALPTPDGRAATITQAVAALGGLDILVNNTVDVRAGRLETLRRRNC